MAEEGFGIGLYDPGGSSQVDETLGLPTYLVSGILTCSVWRTVGAIL
jgi:hypothetical protein